MTSIPKRQRTAGVSPATQEAYLVASVGDRVMTKEGFPGKVDSVLDGFTGGNESYMVTLDDGMGGGEYSGDEITPLLDGRTAKADITAAAIDASMAFDAAGLHLASEFYPELGDILERRLPRENVALNALGSKTAAWNVVDDEGNVYAGPIENSFAARDMIPAMREDGMPGDLHVEKSTDTILPGAFSGWGISDSIPGSVDFPDAKLGHGTPVSIGARVDPEHRWSYDWCRFRRNEHCFYPKELNAEASKEVGSAVWIPFDRGICLRGQWDDQRQCPIGAPGPHSGDSPSYADATVSWEDGGFRGGFPDPNWKPKEGSSELGSLAKDAALNPEFRFHLTAAWRDVQAKAKRIRDEGLVQIVSAVENYVVAKVKGDDDLYQTTIMRQPGANSIAQWECGCKWATYSWARSGRWKKYEGRMCAHALALNYEANAQGMFGREVHEDSQDRAWSRGVKPELPQLVRPPAWRTGSLEMEDSPLASMSKGSSNTPMAKHQGEVCVILGILPDGMVHLQGDRVVPAHEVLHPNWDPTKGLSPGTTGSKVSDKVQSVVSYLKNIIADVDETTPLPFPNAGAWVYDEVGRWDLDSDDDPVDFTDPLRDEDDIPMFEPGSGHHTLPVLDDDDEDTLHDEPEPALPTTTGTVDEDPLVAQALGRTASIPNEGLEYLQSGTPSNTQDSVDIAAAAEAFLQKSALRTFTPMEQEDIINEGADDVRLAANFDSLNITGTHYEALEAALREQDEDDGFWD